MIFDQFANTFWAVFRGHQNLKWEAINIAINQVIILVIGLIVLFLHLPLVWLMLPFICASLFSFLFAGFSVRKILKVKYLLRFDKQILLFLFKIAVPFALIEFLAVSTVILIR